MSAGLGDEAVSELFGGASRGAFLAQISLERRDVVSLPGFAAIATRHVGLSAFAFDSVGGLARPHAWVNGRIEAIVTDQMTFMSTSAATRLSTACGADGCRATAGNPNRARRA